MVSGEKAPCITSPGTMSSQHMVSHNPPMGHSMKPENWLVVGDTGGHWQLWQVWFPNPQCLTYLLAHQKPAFSEWGMWMQGNVWNTSLLSYFASRTFQPSLEVHSSTCTLDSGCLILLASAGPNFCL